MKYIYNLWNNADINADLVYNFKLWIDFPNNIVLMMKIVWRNFKITIKSSRVIAFIFITLLTIVSPFILQSFGPTEHHSWTENKCTSLNQILSKLPSIKFIDGVKNYPDFESKCFELISIFNTCKNVAKLEYTYTYTQRLHEQLIEQFQNSNKSDSAWYGLTDPLIVDSITNEEAQTIYLDNRIYCRLSFLTYRNTKLLYKFYNSEYKIETENPIYDIGSGLYSQIIYTNKIYSL
jgi:hypothetical protein